MVQSQGGAEFQTAGILKYVEDLKREPNIEIGPKDIFEMRSIYIRPSSPAIVEQGIFNSRDLAHVDIRSPTLLQTAGNAFAVMVESADNF